MSVHLKIISSHTPNGSAADGEFSTAIFELSGSNSESIGRRDLQELIWEELGDDYALTDYGTLNNGRLGGKLSIIDWEAPEVGKMIMLPIKE